MSKKAQGISISVVIVAIIALLVLVVLVAIFGGRMGWFGENVGEETSKTCTGSPPQGMGGTILPITTPCPAGYTPIMRNYEDITNPNERCCIPPSDYN